MTWVKLDDQFPDHPKIERAGPQAAWLFVCGLCYCAEHLTNGVIPSSKAARLAPVPPKCVGTLVEVGLWHNHPEGYEVHDYLDYQPSAEKVKAERQAAIDRRRGGRSPDVHANVPPTDDRTSRAGSRPPSPSPSEGQEPKALSTKADRGAVEEVFKVWVEVTERHATRTKLDDRRRRIINRALKAYPVEDVKDAVTGWRNIKHNRGENEAGRVYNDLELLLRDTQHIERFRDAERGAGPSVNGQKVYKECPGCGCTIRDDQEDCGSLCSKRRLRA